MCIINPSWYLIHCFNNSNTSSNFIINIHIISSAFSSSRGDTHATDSIPLNFEEIDVELPLFDALVKIITIIGDML